MIRIIHISDLHYSKDNSGQFNTRLMKPFLKSLKELNESKKIDILCVSGDLVDKGGLGFTSLEDALNEVKTEFLDVIEKELGLDRSQIILCIGNHDVNKNKDEDYVDMGLTSKLNSAEEVAKLISKNMEQFQPGLLRVEEFKSFEKKYYEKTEGVTVTNFETLHELNIDRYVIGVSTLNSAWRYYDSDEKIIIGIDQLTRAVDKQSSCDIKILLSHYDFSQLKDFEKKDIENTAAEQYQIQLFGHTHSQDVYLKRKPTAGLFFSDTSRGLNRTNISATDTEYKNGFSIIDLDIDSLKISFSSKVYSKQRNEYVLDTDLLGDPGIVTFELQTNENFSMLHKISNRIDEQSSEQMDAHILSYGMETIAPQSFNDIFVEPRFTDKKNTNPDEEKVVYLKEITDNTDQNFIVLGLKETGKTVLLDYLTKFYSENIHRNQIVPILIDFTQLPPSHKVETCISQTIGIPKKNVPEFAEKNRIVLLFDNFEGNNIYLIKKVEEFLVQYPNTRFIATVQIDISGKMPLNLVNSSLYSNSTILELKYFNSRQITDLTNKWYSKSSFPNIENKKKKILKLINSFELPRTPLLISMFLWIFETQEDYQPVNQATMLETFIEKMFKKHDFEQTLYSEFDFKNKESLLTEIALNMYKNGNDNYSMNKADLLRFIVEYLRQREFDFNAEKILNEFIDIRLFDVDSDNVESIVRFRFNCFFQYYLMKNLDKQEFMDHVLKDENYLLFYNELNLYSGLKRNKIDLLDKAISRMEHYFSDLQKQVDEKHISFDSFFETERSLSEQLGKEKKDLSLESHKAEINKDIEIIDDKFYEGSKKDNKIKKKDMKLTQFQKLELSLVIAANILRNTEELPDPNKKYEAFCEVLRCSLIYVTLYKQLFWDHIKNNEKDFDEEKQKESKMILSFLPMINEAFLEEQLGTAKLNPVIKRHISQIITKKEVSQLEKFSTVFLYSDFRGTDYLKVIQSYLAEIKGNYIRDMTLYKLVSYYYFRSDSKQSDKDLEKLISLLVESSAKVKRKRGFIFDKNKVIAFYRDKRKEFIKENPQD